MKESRRNFNYALRKCESDEGQHRADAIAAALYKDFTKKLFGILGPKISVKVVLQLVLEVFETSDYF